MRLLFGLFGGLLTATSAMAEPVDWQMNLPAPATPLMEWVYDFNTFLLVICGIVSAIVLGLMVYIVIRFSEKNNQTPSTVTHNTKLEIIWTAIPVLILLIIAVPSFRLLAYTENIPDFDMTIKATGHQWYWSYDYVGEEGLEFDALMMDDSALQPHQPRLLTSDMPVTVPVNKTVRLLVTASDVLHAWAMPAFGVKVDAVPGRINQLWFRPTKVGIYYGQCSELCGSRHSFMPIELHVVSQRDYTRWVARVKAQLAGVDNSMQVASN